MDFFEILLIIAALAASVISSAKKSAKKKADRLPKPPRNQAEEERDDPWESLRRYVKPEEEYTYEPSGHSDKEPAYVTFEDHRDEEEEAAALIESRKRETELRRERQVGYKSTGNKRNTSKYKHAAEDKDIVPESDSINDVVDDFDIRKAILYSEILKPKFEE